jgi:hypothetical protein
MGSSGRRLAAVMNPSRDMLMMKTTLLIATSQGRSVGPYGEQQGRSKRFGLG